MLYIGEHLDKLSVIESEDDRKAFYNKYKTPTLAKYFSLILRGVKWKECLKNREVLFDVEAYGRNPSNLHKAFRQKLVYFVEGMGYDSLPDKKVIEMFDKLTSSLHHNESSFLHDLINERFILDNAFEGELEWVVKHFNF